MGGMGGNWGRGRGRTRNLKWLPKLVYEVVIGMAADEKCTAGIVERWVRKIYPTEVEVQLQKRNGFGADDIIHLLRQNAKTGLLRETDHPKRPGCHPIEFIRTHQSV
jgi:hypothetical protein